MIQSYMRGWKYDKKKEDLVENGESELRLPGTGQAMMQVGGRFFLALSIPKTVLLTLLMSCFHSLIGDNRRLECLRSP